MVEGDSIGKDKFAGKCAGDIERVYVRAHGQEMGWQVRGMTGQVHHVVKKCKTCKKHIQKHRKDIANVG